MAEMMEAIGKLAEKIGVIPAIIIGIIIAGGGFVLKMRDKEVEELKKTAATLKQENLLDKQTIRDTMNQTRYAVDTILKELNELTGEVKGAIDMVKVLMVLEKKRGE